MGGLLSTLQAAKQRVSARLRLIAANRAYVAFRRELCQGQAEPTLDNVVSQLATQAQIDSQIYREWLARLKLPPIRHRKYWEFAFIMQALGQHDLLREGFRGLGFGVGKEPLAAMMASLGCEVVASDAAPELAMAAGWGKNDEHASGL